MRVSGGGLGFELDAGWPKVPDGVDISDASGVCLAGGSVFVLVRAPSQVLRLSLAGELLDAWTPAGASDRVHGISADTDALYVVDDGRHHVGKYAFDGTLLAEIGPCGQPSDTGHEAGDHVAATVRRASGPYRHPTNLDADDGHLYVSDGYGNARVHVFTRSGELVRSWGSAGSRPGEFRLPHDLAVHPDGRIFVADSENDRLQIFTPEGRLCDIWLDVQRPRAVHVDSAGLVYVGELGWEPGDVSGQHGRLGSARPARVSIFDTGGNLRLRWGSSSPELAGNFVAPHAITVDSDGTLYVAEVTRTIGIMSGKVPPGTHSLQCFRPTQ